MFFLFALYSRIKKPSICMYSLANFFVLCNLFYVEQIVQSGLVVVFGQSLVKD